MPERPGRGPETPDPSLLQNKKGLSSHKFHSKEDCFMQNWNKTEEQIICYLFDKTQKFNNGHLKFPQRETFKGVPSATQAMGLKERYEDILKKKDEFSCLKHSSQREGPTSFSVLLWKDEDEKTRQMCITFYANRRNSVVKLNGCN
jgi:hypothetical protein